jgi:hypothetical protein
MVQAWVTDADLVAAQRRFAAAVPGLVLPSAYAVARADPGRLEFGHINPPGAVRPLPAGPDDEAFRALLATQPHSADCRAHFAVDADVSRR